MTKPKRILFAGYAPVHFLCFRPIYEALRQDERVDVWLTGGFRRQVDDETRYDLEGFYDPYGVDAQRVAPFEELRDATDAWVTDMRTIGCTRKPSRLRSPEMARFFHRCWRFEMSPCRQRGATSTITIDSFGKQRQLGSNSCKD